MPSSIPNILIVQADARETEIVSELIRDVVRAQVDTTNSGERALELVSRTNYQLIIADSGGAAVDGMAILERVKHLSPSTAIILTSGLATIEDAVKAMRLGAEEYFKKPFNLEHFKLAVRRCLDRRALYTGDQSVTGLMMLLNACQLVSGSLEEDKIIDTVAAYLHRETASKGFAVFRMDKEQRTRVTTDSDTDPDVVEVLIDSHHVIGACRDEKTHIKIVPRGASAPEMAVFQFKCSGAAEYFAICLNPSWATPPEEVASRFRVLQAQVEMTGRNISNYRGVRHLLYLDEPTGLYNTRYLQHCLDEFFTRAAGDQKATFSILFLDVDRFKSVNDRHGHLIGTRLLHEVGQLIKKGLRNGDVAFRYGGDEFIAILDGAGAEEAREIAERIRQAVEKHSFLAREALNIRLTVSIGVANCPEHASTKREVIEAADNAMYAVKRDCRNNVYIAAKKAAA